MLTIDLTWFMKNMSCVNSVNKQSPTRSQGIRLWTWCLRLRQGRSELFQRKPHLKENSNSTTPIWTFWDPNRTPAVTSSGRTSGNTVKHSHFTHPLTHLPTMRSSSSPYRNIGDDSGKQGTQVPSSTDEGDSRETGCEKNHNGKLRRHKTPSVHTKTTVYTVEI